MNSLKNDTDPSGIPQYDYCEGNDRTRPRLQGDRPWVEHENTIFVPISNVGSVPATNVNVTAYVNSPPGIGGNGTWKTLRTEPVANVTPEAEKHTCLSVAIFPQAGERTASNNRAQENVSHFESAGLSSHQPVVFDAEVRSPFSVWKRVELRMRRMPEGWHAVVNKEWVWVPPKGNVPVQAVIWTDLNSPRARDHRRIPAEAFPRVEGWTDVGDHEYKPIGGILVPIRANKRTRIHLEVTEDAGRIRVFARLDPRSADVPGVVEVTDAAGARNLVPVTSQQNGDIQVDVPVVPGRYDVQVFTNSTPEAAEAESEIQQIVVRP